jgi:hypothetical protein
MSWRPSAPDPEIGGWYVAWYADNRGTVCHITGDALAAREVEAVDDLVRPQISVGVGPTLEDVDVRCDRR